jgi:hypothetical protein
MTCAAVASSREARPYGLSIERPSTLETRGDMLDREPMAINQVPGVRHRPGEPPLHPGLTVRVPQASAGRSLILSRAHARGCRQSASGEVARHCNNRVTRIPPSGRRVPDKAAKTPILETDAPDADPKDLGDDSVSSHMDGDSSSASLSRGKSARTLSFHSAVRLIPDRGATVRSAGSCST